MQFQNLSAQATACDLKLKALVLCKLFAVNQLHVTLDSCLCLCSARTRTTTEPVALKAENTFNPSLGVFLNLSLDFLFFEVGRIIAFVKF